MFRKIWLPSFTQKPGFWRKIWQKRHLFELKSGQNSTKEQSWLKIRFGLSMTKNPESNIWLDGFEFFLIFWVLILSYLTLPQVVPGTFL